MKDVVAYYGRVLNGSRGKDGYEIMTRSEGKTVVGGLESVWAALDSMNAPASEAKSLAMFEQLMVKVEKQERRRRLVRQLWRTVSAVVAAATGAGAYRLLTH